MERKIYRSRRNRVFLGICGGLGDYFNIDPVIIRIVVVVLVLASWVFPVLVAYLIAALIIPLEGSSESVPRDNMRENIDDLKNTANSLGQEIRETFGGKKDDGQSDGGSASPATGAYSTRPASRSGLLILGIIIIGMGILVIFNNFFDFILWRVFWPVMLIVAGVAVILYVLKRQEK